MSSITEQSKLKDTAIMNNWPQVPQHLHRKLTLETISDPMKTGNAASISTTITILEQQTQ